MELGLAELAISVMGALDNAGLMASGAGLLANLARNPHNQAGLAAAGAVQMLVEGMQKHADDVEVQQRTIGDPEVYM